MKTENGSRYQETEIVSYVQVINKAEIDRYLQRGKRKVCDCVHGVEELEVEDEVGELFLPKDKKREKEKSGKEREGGKAKGGKLERESVNNDTSRKDLDEHAVLRLTWPAEMMCIPAKLSFRQA